MSILEFLWIFVLIGNSNRRIAVSSIFRHIISDGLNIEGESFDCPRSYL